MPGAELFTTLIYQPFLNILVFFYWMLGVLGTADMGVAVIMLTLVIRGLMLPISLASQRSEKERRAISEEVKRIHEEHTDDPVMLKKQTKEVFRSNSRIVISEMVSLVIQVVIALMLWRIFETGLKGQDLHLIYPFMPEVKTPFNLVFLDRFDLTHTSFLLNLLQSLMIFIVETLSILTSPYPTSRGEVVRLQLTLPIVSFLIFMRLPAGKKLFVITTLMVSAVLILTRYIRYRFIEYKEKRAARQAAMEEDQLVVDLQ